MRRAQRKYLSMRLAVRLAELRSPLERAYRASIYCAHELHQEHGRLTTRYCGQRWCLTCNAIRIGRAINTYGPILATWQDKYFVTLTVRNVSADQLAATLVAMQGDFSAIARAARRKRGERRMPFKAIRKLECTYNERTGEYHPHFHVVIEGEATARFLLRQWLTRHPDTAHERAQDIRRCRDEEAHELFKYVTKLVTRGRFMNAMALDVIFQAMHGRRVFQTSGFVIPKDTPDPDASDIIPDEATPTIVHPLKRIRWRWDQGAADWIDTKTGECLIGYVPTDRLARLLSTVQERPPDS